MRLSEWFKFCNFLIMSKAMVDIPKNIFLMRHAQSTYNAAIRSPITWLKPTFYLRGFDPGDDFIDARLSEKGLRQVDKMREK